MVNESCVSDVHESMKVKVNGTEAPGVMILPCVSEKRKTISDINIFITNVCTEVIYTSGHITYLYI